MSSNNVGDYLLQKKGRKMVKKIIGLFVVTLLFGCATTGGDTGAGKSSFTQHKFPLGNGKEFSLKKTDCNIDGGSLKNDGSYASSGSYGILVATNSTSNVALDQYRVSCGAVRAGGKSSCVIQHVDGDSSFKNYGGVGCPDMKFNLKDFRVF